VRLTRLANLFAPFAGGVSHYVPRAADIRSALYLAASTDPTIAALTGGRIFALYLPQKTLATDAQTPALLIRIVSISRPRNLSGPDGTAIARVAVEGLTKEIETAAAIAEAARQRFDAVPNLQPLATPDGGSIFILTCEAIDEGDQAEDLGDGTGRPLTPTRFEFRVKYREPKPARLGVSIPPVVAAGVVANSFAYWGTAPYMRVWTDLS
jgi:hypothetical protein